jgi:predicted transglutaminase-like cysteine proteinase
MAASLAALLVVAPATSAGLIVMTPSLFGTQELHSKNLQAFPKWRSVLTRFDRELTTCTPDRCRLGEWNLLLAVLRGWDVTTQLMLVNSAMNRHRYIEDAFNWDLADYWETPLQFLDRSGDCEDFAIAKYLALRSVGVPAEDMRVVIVRDRVRQRMHAVLAVYVRGRAMILDNLRNEIIGADLIDDYEPIYSINERGWWLHRR